MFEQFARINQIPRPSKHEEQVIEYLKRFGEERNLETVVDDAGNVLIRKAAKLPLKAWRTGRRSYCRVIWIWCARR